MIFLNTFLWIATSDHRNAASPSLLASMPNGTDVIGAHRPAKLDAFIPWRSASGTRPSAGCARGSRSNPAGFDRDGACAIHT